MQSPKRLRTDSTTDLSSSASSNASMPSISSLIAPNAHPSSRSPSVSPSLSSAYPVAIYPHGHQQPQKTPEEQMTRLLSDVRALEQGQLNMLSDIAQLQDGLQTLRYGQRKLLQEVNGLQQALNNTNLLLTTLVNSVGCGCHGPLPSPPASTNSSSTHSSPASSDNHHTSPHNSHSHPVQLPVFGGVPGYAHMATGHYANSPATSYAAPVGGKAGARA
ncbi:hypothetical protein FPQ18DRAFT_396897 [Pyronema domesticum]|uniref:Uncharacterized protein n=1 Tax=Pyronema omphalodes (strain CBS 100304) TaxID=1076935 RepID=U4LIE3_PYROM|nr:hypothetical protein FPQ18DRAFT_396897 [Pyronema domesticum]CCX31864.1 Protein of unknown function [Pyronema omphalodes CBS 100304]